MRCIYLVVIWAFRAGHESLAGNRNAACDGLYGKRRRGSNAPTIGEFLPQYAGKSASWCRRCYKANSLFVSQDWSPEDWYRSGDIEGISSLIIHSANSVGYWAGWVLKRSRFAADVATSM